MSRKGKLPVSVPSGVDVKIDGQTIGVKGPKGNLSLDVKSGIQMEMKDSSIQLTIAEGKVDFGKFLGLYRSLVQNMVTGVTEGFKKELEMIGVGFRAAVQGSLLDLQIGVSHPLKLPIPQGIQVNVEKNTAITIEGADCQLVGQFAATVRSKRPPEPYKGKGIRYKGEYVRRKAGKAGKGK